MLYVYGNDPTEGAKLVMDERGESYWSFPLIM